MQPNEEVTPHNGTWPDGALAFFYDDGPRFSCVFKVVSLLEGAPLQRLAAGKQVLKRYAFSDPDLMTDSEGTLDARKVFHRVSLRARLGVMMVLAPEVQDDALSDFAEDSSGSPLARFLQENSRSRRFKLHLMQRAVKRAFMVQSLAGPSGGAYTEVHTRAARKIQRMFWSSRLGRAWVKVRELSTLKIQNAFRNRRARQGMRREMRMLKKESEIVRRAPLV